MEYRILNKNNSYPQNTFGCFVDEGNKIPNSKFHIPHATSRAFTLVEMIIYLAIFSFLSIVAVNGVIVSMKSFYAIRLAQNINQSATASMERMAYEIRNAYDIDTANSITGSTPGRLTLLTKDSGGNNTTVEFYTASSSNQLMVVDYSTVGATWTQKGTSQDYRGVAMSADGRYQTSVAGTGYIYISSDFGATWTQKGTSQDYRGVAMSADGRYQTATSDPGHIYISSDFGATWTQKGTSQDYRGVAMSADGKYQTATVSGGYIYISSDFGATWTQKGTFQDYRGVAMSADGKYQTAISDPGHIYISSDFGATWTQKGTSQDYRGVAMSADGKYQTAVVGTGYIYISSDFGATWTQKGTSQDYRGVAMSADGRYQAAPVSGGYIYESAASMAGANQLWMKVGGVNQGLLMVKTSVLTNLVFRAITTPNSKAVKIEMTVQDARQDLTNTIKFYDTIILRGSLH